jgi:hypothetical protein
VAGKAKPGELKPEALGIDLGVVTLSREGVRSSIYGTLEFMSPVSELDMQMVTPAESKAYASWRVAYRRDWRARFDPLAIRAGVEPQRISADLTVMPLTANTSYRLLVELARGAAMAPLAGDRHKTLLHGMVAVNTSSPLFKLVDKLDWLGNTAELYFDPDPFWQDLARIVALSEATVEDFAKFAESRMGRLPIAARFAVADRAKARSFLDTVRIDWKKGKSGDKITFDDLTYRGESYSRVVNRSGAPSSMVLYSFLGKNFLTVAFSEEVLKRAIDRELARPASQYQPAKSERESADEPWLGTHLCLQVDRSVLEVANSLSRGEYQRAMQRKAWENLPILNEWKRLFPTQDPVEVHRRVW